MSVAIAIGLALLLGAGLSAQAGINASLRAKVGHPIQASVVSLVIGLGFMVLLALLTGARAPSAASISRTPFWMYLGGVIGALYVLGIIVLAPRLGAATLMALVVTGQLIAALVIDQMGWLGFVHHPASGVRLVGVVLLVVGVVLIRREA